MAAALPGPTASRRTRLRAAALVTAAFVAGLAVGLRDGQARSADPASSTPRRHGVASGDDATARPPGPTRRVAGVPAGFARTPDGAVAAAAAFVTTGQALLDMDPLAVEKAVRQMAAAATADAQVDDLLGRLAAVRDTLAPGTGPVAYRQAAVSWRLAGFTPDRARVAVWNVGVLSRDGVAPPQAGWAVSTFDLVWERGDWRVWGETVAPGPAPLPDDSAPPATSAELSAALAGFADFGAAP